MRNLRSYYSASISEFLIQSSSEIIGIIHANNISAETTIQQNNTWESEIKIITIYAQTKIVQNITNPQSRLVRITVGLKNSIV